MDVLNFISWLKNKRQVTTVDASQTIIPIGLKDSRRDDGYLPGAISVADFIALSSGLPDFIEYNTTDKTLWNNGKGNNSSNLSYGESALMNNAPSLINTDGHFNTAIGTNALKNNTIGGINTALGSESLVSNTTGRANVALGYFALYGNTTGKGNIGIGGQALANVTVGERNIGIGEATNAGSTGIGNVIIGNAAASNNYSHSVVLGRSAAATASNQFVVGSAAYNAGTIATETITANRTWTVRINGVNYKIPMVAI